MRRWFIRAAAVAMAAAALVSCLVGAAHAQPAPGTPQPPDPIVEEGQAPKTDAPRAEETGGWQEDLDALVADYMVVPLDKVLFVDVWVFDGVNEGVVFPLAVLVLIVGALFFTVRLGFINVRGFGHAIGLVRGKYDNPDDPGDVSHFQALTTALSATVGLGNIAGVAIAVSIGGPGATVWMITVGLLGMASKFTECTLGQKYREERPDGSVMGGGMYYLSKGLAELGKPGLGKVLAVAFSVMCIGGALAAGGAFQVNQALTIVRQQVPFFDDHRWVYGVMMVGLVGVVIIGGIKRIAHVAEAIVPFMCAVYVLMCIYILGVNAAEIPAAFGTIFGAAFSWEAGFGGFMGVLIMGLKRGSFSNEAGLGSAAIAHSAAKTEYPVQEGFVALLEPFIDTVVVCTMTALVIVITGAYDATNPAYADLIVSENGAALTAAAMGSEVSWFPWVLVVAVALFAFSTNISWAYYGDRCWTWLFGEKYVIVYQVLFLCGIFLGAVATATNILAFGDLLLLGMALPNIPGLILLSGVVKRELDAYRKKVATGEVGPGRT